MSEPPYSPMLDVEQKHKLSFDGCTIIPKPDEDFEDDENGVLSFDGYAIVPKEMYRELVDLWHRAYTPMPGAGFPWEAVIKDEEL